MRCLAADRKEPKQISFRVSEEEYQRLASMAEEFGLSVTAFCKAKAQGAKMKAPKINKQRALEIASELRRIGGNVNQIAKRINSGENTSEAQLKGIQKELERIWQQLS